MTDGYRFGGSFHDGVSYAKSNERYTKWAENVDQNIREKYGEVRMIRKRPEKDTMAPPGQIKYPPKQGLYLRDIISRIQREEEQAANRAYGKELARRSSEDRGLPTPLAGPEKALNDLVGALLRACGIVEKEQELYKSIPSLRTSLIRKIIKDHYG